MMVESLVFLSLAVLLKLVDATDKDSRLLLYRLVLILAFYTDTLHYLKDRFHCWLLAYQFNNIVYSDSYLENTRYVSTSKVNAIHGSLPVEKIFALVNRFSPLVAISSSMITEYLGAVTRTDL